MSCVLSKMVRETRTKAMTAASLLRCARCVKEKSSAMVRVSRVTTQTLYPDYFKKN